MPVGAWIHPFLPRPSIVKIPLTGRLVIIEESNRISWGGSALECSDQPAELYHSGIFPSSNAPKGPMQFV